MDAAAAAPKVDTPRTERSSTGSTGSTQKNAPAKKSDKLTASGRKKIDTTPQDKSKLSGEKVGSNPINFSQWKDNLRTGRADGNSTRQLQEVLNKGRADDKKLAVDGKFGGMTQDAVRQFQKSKGLKEDGIVGKYTRAALEREQTKGSKDPNTTIPSGGIKELNQAVAQQQQATRDRQAGQTGGGFNTVRGADPAKANAQDRATSIPSGENAEFPKPGIWGGLKEKIFGKPSATVNAPPPPAPAPAPRVDSVGPIPTQDGLPLFTAGA